MNNKIATKDHELGQTLIETLVAIFILTGGLLSAIGLATYSFQSTDSATRQIVGTALAREGVEAIQNIRDTNWLTSTLESCDFLGAGQLCHQSWNTNLSAGSYVPQYVGDTWSLIPLNSLNHQLYLDQNTGLYHHFTGNGFISTIYSRRITLQYDTSTAPFNNPQNPKIIGVSTVWWRSRKCPPTNNPDSLPQSCKVTLELHLTNWKDY